MQEVKPKIALYIPQEMQEMSGYLSSYGQIFVQILQFGDGELRTPGYGSPMDGLRISCQCDTSASGGGQSYAWQFEFSDSGCLSNPDRMMERAKLLKRLQTKLGKIADEWGHPRTFGEFVVHAFHALGADSYAIRVNDGLHSPTFSEMRLNWTRSASGVRYRIEKMLQEWHNVRQTPHAEKETANAA